MLLIDAGNSAIKLRQYDGEKMWQDWRIGWKDDLRTSARELSELLSSINPASIYLASVASQQQTECILSVAREVLPDVPNQRLTTLPQLGGITNAYAEYSHLGVDRWLTFMASARVSPRDVIIIDAGSAITVDLVSKTGGHLGGAIIAGLHTSQARLKSLFPHVDFHSPEIRQTVNPGRSTAQCLHLDSGTDPVTYVSELCQRWQTWLAPGFEVLLCGQDASYFKGRFDAVEREIPDLVFLGMLQQIEWQG